MHPLPALQKTFHYVTQLLHMSTVVQGYVTAYRAIYRVMQGYVGLCSAMQGYVGLGMAVYGYVWLCRAMYGCVWLCMAMQGCVWLCMAVYGYVHTYIHTYFIGSSPRGFSESILHYKIINQVHDNKNITMIKQDKGQ